MRVRNLRGATLAYCHHAVLQLQGYSHGELLLRTRVNSENSSNRSHHRVDGDTEWDQVRGVRCHPHHQRDHEDRFQR